MIRSARRASGVSQAQLARMAGVSRATVNYAEQGRSALRADALLRLLAPLGLSIAGALPHADDTPTDAVAQLAASASVSYRKPMPVSAVERALTSGEYESEWLPHIATMVDEASDSLLLRAVREAAAKSSTPAHRIWRNLTTIAHSVTSPHPRWA